MNGRKGRHVLRDGEREREGLFAGERKELVSSWARQVKVGPAQISGQTEDQYWVSERTVKRGKRGAL